MSKQSLMMQVEHPGGGKGIYSIVNNVNTGRDLRSLSTNEDPISFNQTQPYNGYNTLTSGADFKQYLDS